MPMCPFARGFCSSSRSDRDEGFPTHRRATPTPEEAGYSKSIGCYFFIAGAPPPPGKIFSTCSCGRGMTCTETSSPTRRAAAAPASVAAFTAPTSPRTITGTSPEPIYSLPMRTTLAALTIASAASIEPTRPLVSIIPSASLDIGSSTRVIPVRLQKTYTHIAGSAETSTPSRLNQGNARGWQYFDCLLSKPLSSGMTSFRGVGNAGFIWFYPNKWERRTIKVGIHGQGHVLRHRPTDQQGASVLAHTYE